MARPKSSCHGADPSVDLVHPAIIFPEHRKRQMQPNEDRVQGRLTRCRDRRRKPMVDCESTKPEPSTHGIRRRAKGVKRKRYSNPSSSRTEMKPQGCHAFTHQGHICAAFEDLKKALVAFEERIESHFKGLDVKIDSLCCLVKSFQMQVHNMDQLQNSRTSPCRTGAGNSLIRNTVQLKDVSFDQDTSGNTKSTVVPGSGSSPVYNSPTIKETMGIGGIDVLETTWVDRRTAAFCAWMKEAKLNPKNMLLNVPGGALRWADLDWFEVLYKARGHLSNFHIDVLANLAIIRFDQHDPNASRNWIAFDQNMSHALLAKDFNVEAFLKCNTLANSRFPPSLKKITRVFGVANVQANHWVLYMLTMAEKKISVYDSLNLESDILEDHFLPLPSNIQELFAYAEDDAGRHGSGCVFPPWHVDICRDMPRQTNLHDCGVLVVKFLECLVHGVPLMRLDADRCHIYRRSFCAQLHDFSTQNA